MKKYNNYKDSGIEWIGDIPTDWSCTKLKFHTKKIIDGAHFTPTYIEKSQDSIPFLRVTDLHSKEIVLDEVKYIPLSEHQQLIKRCNPEEGDLLLSKNGTIGLMKIINWKWEFSIFVSLCLIKFEKSLLNSFFYYFFESNIVDRQLFESSQKTSVTNLHLEKIKELRLTLPPIAEQYLISNYLDHKTTLIDNLITKKEQFITLLEEERKAIINQAVTKGLDPNVKMKDSGIEWLGEIPEHWEAKKLKLVFNPSKGLTITKENLKDEGIECVNYGEVHSKFGFELDTNIHKLKYVDLSYLESDKRSLIESGDFVFADTSEDIAGAGNFTYLKSEGKIFAGYHTIVLKPIENLNSRFFAYEFDSIPFRTQIRQAVKGVKVFSITQAILKNVQTWFPPKNEQKAISDFLTTETEKIDAIIFKAKEEIELLKEYKIALISEVVTGKIDVRDVVLN
jgi:type I restriction enzyme S subunit